MLRLLMLPITGRARITSLNATINIPHFLFKNSDGGHTSYPEAAVE